MFANLFPPRRSAAARTIRRSLAGRSRRRVFELLEDRQMLTGGGLLQTLVDPASGAGDLIWEFGGRVGEHGGRGIAL